MNKVDRIRLCCQSYVENLSVDSQLNHKIAAGVCCYLRLCLGHVNVLHFSHKSNHSVYSNYSPPCSLSPFAVQLNSFAILRARWKHVFTSHATTLSTELFCVNIYDRQANQFEKLPSFQHQQISNAHTKSFCVKHILFYVWFFFHSDYFFSIRYYI